MKPTQQQKDNLSAILNSKLKYRETHSEVFDHLLTAVEQRNGRKDFEHEVEVVLEEDFGGYEGLQKMEQKTFDSVRKAGSATYKRYLLKQIIGPELLLTIAVGVMVYLLLKSNIPCIYNIVALANLYLCCLPRFINWYRNFRNGYIFKDKTGSMKDEMFSSLSYIPLSYWFWGRVGYMFISQTTDPLYFDSTFTIGTVLMNWVLVFAFIKLCRDDFKVTMLSL